VGKSVTERIFDSFQGDESKSQAEEYSAKVYQAWKEISASLGRSALLVFLLIAIFELLIYQPTSADISIGAFTLSNAPIVQIALPTIVAFVLYDGYRMSVRWLHLQWAYMTLTRMLTPLQGDNYLDLLIGPNLPSLWGIGASPGSGIATTSDRFIFRVNRIMMYSTMAIVPIAFEFQAYYRLIQKFSDDNILLWIGLIITALLNISTALYILLGMCAADRRASGERPAEP
jgi:hypothetical protein